MRIWVKRSLAGLLALVLAGGAAAAWKQEELSRLASVLVLFEPDRIVGNFSHMDAMFPSVMLDRGDLPVSPLPDGPRMVLPEGAEDWIAARTVTALLVLKDGALVYEDYYQGTGPDDLRIGWSVSKSWLSALAGVLIDEGLIALDDPLDRHAPMLAGSAYEGVSLRDALQMSTGVAFDEDYEDFWSDINQMGRVLALGQSMDGFVGGLDARAGPPGRWTYVSTDTHAVAMALRGAAGKPLPELISEKLVQPLGLERAPSFVTDGHGVAFALGGLSVTARDQARFAQMLLQGGR